MACLTITMYVVNNGKEMKLRLYRIVALLEEVQD